MATRKKRRKSSKRRGGKRKVARKAARRKASRTSRKGKGHIPLPILEKRAKKLVRLVRKRGGEV